MRRDAHLELAVAAPIAPELDAELELGVAGLVEFEPRRPLVAEELEQALLLLLDRALVVGVAQRRSERGRLGVRAAPSESEAHAHEVRVLRRRVLEEVVRGAVEELLALSLVLDLSIGQLERHDLEPRRLAAELVREEAAEGVGREARGRASIRACVVTVWVPARASKVEPGTFRGLHKFLKGINLAGGIEDSFR